MSFVKSSVLFTLFLINITAIMANPGPCNKIITGDVFDSLTSKTLPYASIAIEELGKGAHSDNKGHFHLDSLCAGIYKVTCHLIGYKTVSKTIDISKTTKLNFYLQQENIELKEVRVETDRRKQEIIQTQTSLHGRELQQTRGLSLAESLTGITGVNMIKTGPSIAKPVIHGMYGNRVLIVNNEVRQEGQQWGSEHAPEIDPFIASEITVIKGPASIRYGPDAMGGVILVNPKSLKEEHGYTGEINLVGLSNNRQGVGSGIIDGNIKEIEGLAFRLQGTYKRAGNSFAPEYNMGNTGFQEINFSTAARFKRGNMELGIFYSRFNTTLGILSKSHVGNITDLLRLIDSEIPDTSEFTYKIGRPKQEVSHDLLKLYVNNSGDAGKFKMIYAFQQNYRAEYDAHRRYNQNLGDKPQVEFNLYTNSVDLQWEHKKFKNIEGSIGALGTVQANVYEGIKLIPNFTSYTGGIYWLEKYTKGKFILETGIRHDYKWLRSYENTNNSITSNYLNWSNTIGSLGASFEITKELTLETTLSKAWRPASINEMFMDGVHHGAGSYEKGNIGLKSESQYSLSSHIKYYGENIHGEIGGYFNLIDNYIYLKPDSVPTLTIRGAFPSFYYTKADASYYGLDSDLTFHINSKTNFNSKISLVRARNRDTKDYIEYIPADQFTHSLIFNLPKVYKFNDIYLTLTNHSVLKQVRVPDNFEYLPPPQGYSIFNTDFSFSLPSKGAQIEFGFTVNNIFNTNYRNYLNRFRYFTDEVGRNFTIRAKIPIQLFN